MIEYIECGWCRETIVKKNSLHKFCSAKCKKKSWRNNNNKPEFPDFIPKRNRKPATPLITEQKLKEPTIITKSESPTRLKRKPVRNDSPINESVIDESKKEELVVSENTERDIKERKVIDTLIAAFDDMLARQIKKEVKQGFSTQKEIDKEIMKLESKRVKVIRQGNKLNKAIRKYVKKISKKIMSGKISNSEGQIRIDTIRNKEVKKLCKIIRNRSWIMIYKEDYKF